MTQREALEVLAENRMDYIVITMMSTVGIWPQLSDTALDFAYFPSSMGETPPLGLGLALAQPDRGVVVVNGDGSMLMNLGTLVTIASYPANLFLIVVDNEMYETTGGQKRPGIGHADFAGLASAAGIPRVYSFDTVDSWNAGVTESLSEPGPVFIWLKVEGRKGLDIPKAPHPMGEQIIRLQKALGVEPVLSD